MSGGTATCKVINYLFVYFFVFDVHGDLGAHNISDLETNKINKNNK